VRLSSQARQLAFHTCSHHISKSLDINRSVALRSDLVATPLRDFYVALLAKGMKPEMARLNLHPR
jgi:hypothetical protein